MSCQRIIRRNVRRVRLQRAKAALPRLRMRHAAGVVLTAQAQVSCVRFAEICREVIVPAIRAMDKGAD